MYTVNCEDQKCRNAPLVTADCCRSTCVMANCRSTFTPTSSSFLLSYLFFFFSCFLLLALHLKIQSYFDTTLECHCYFSAASWVFVGLILVCSCLHYPSLPPPTSSNSLLDILKICVFPSPSLTHRHFPSRDLTVHLRYRQKWRATL